MKTLALVIVALALLTGGCLRSGEGVFVISADGGQAAKTREFEHFQGAVDRLFRRSLFVAHYRIRDPWRVRLVLQRGADGRLVAVNVEDVEVRSDRDAIGYAIQAVRETCESTVFSAEFFDHMTSGNELRLTLRFDKPLDLSSG